MNDVTVIVQFCGFKKDNLAEQKDDALSNGLPEHEQNRN